jgi:4-methyl-5(b-hydroxyethyl)-thiazole monophosphate biosynthesis
MTNPTPKILVPLADGFEEIEAVTVIDVLRRADLDVTVAALGNLQVRGAHQMTIEADVILADLDLSVFGAVCLPGGMEGTLTMMEDERLLGFVRDLHERGSLVSAICAAPMVLARAGIEAGQQVTSHPAVRERLGEAEVCSEPRVVRSGALITSQGPGTSMEFALALVEEICGAAKAEELAAAMVVAVPHSAS